MNIESAFYNLLTADTDVGSFFNTIEPLVKPEEASEPALIYQKITGPKHYEINAAYPRFQVSIYTDNYPDLKKGASYVKDCLRRYKGISEGVHIKNISMIDERETPEQDAGLLRIDQDYKVIYKE